MTGPYCAHVLDADPLQLPDWSQLLWFPRVRSNVPMLFVISIVVNIGMWLERYVIVVTSLHRDFVPAAWGMYHGTFWDYATFYGTIGLFFIAAVPVHPVPAGDLDRRDARSWSTRPQPAVAEAIVPARSRPRYDPRWTRVMDEKNPPIYGLLAEYTSPESLVAAAELSNTLSQATT